MPLKWQKKIITGIEIIEYRVGVRMIKAVKIADNIKFRSKDSQKSENKESHTLPNNIRTQFEQGTQRVMSAFIDYPAKGLMGDINSNFYEFLTMGIVPYIAGSAMFMRVFNITKHLDAKGHKSASNFGKKMAMGVILYGVLKSLSKALVTKPVKAFTGVDTEMPYQNKVYNLPKGPDETADFDIRWQQRKIFDSKEFYRKDLLEKEFPNKAYFNNVAKKLGLGENLNDSVSETSPIIQNIVATSNLAKSLSSYCWAAVGVGMATQDAWLDFFSTLGNKKQYVAKEGENFVTRVINKTKNFTKNIWNGSIALIKAFGKSFKQLWQGNASKSGFPKHAGKALILFSTLVTSVLTANTIIRARSLAQNNNKKTIDNKKESIEI